jgi:protein tyrosine phosphatase (PTP) superfamily phosphohydrolase (DUF442 family)
VARGIVALLLALTGSFWAWRHITDNFGVVVAGQHPVYRSDQMAPDTLALVIRKLGIKTVINLRGPNPGDFWYDQERLTTLANGAQQVDMPLSSCEWMSRDQALSLAEALKTARRPLLIHCFHGSERTGLASAMTRLLTDGQTVDDARKSFSWWYLFTGLGDGVVTLRQFEQYRAWLAEHQKDHTPEVFMTWLKTDFKPGKPSRELWPYDPYPLLVRSRPAATEPEIAQTPANLGSTRR